MLPKTLQFRNLTKESSLLIGAFLAGAGFLWWLSRRRSSAVAQGPPVARPVPGVAFPRTGRLIAFGYKRTEDHTHQGVDLGAPVGTPVYAARGGRVTHAHSSVRRGFSGYGRVVVIETEPTNATPEIYYMYAHLEDVLVSPGQFVKTGDQIGTVGRTCFRTEDPTHMCGGAHLHFEASPRAYPQHSEAWRYDPEQVLVAIANGVAPGAWVTT
jgi:murein DD-endopeptidase MepM/ murein hydrolase activator NlpD